MSQVELESTGVVQLSVMTRRCRTSASSPDQVSVTIKANHVLVVKE